jgi:pimeloyl-ACP methyl ester carboxylesterase
MRVQTSFHDVGTLAQLIITQIFRICLLGRATTFNFNPSPDQIKKGKTPVVLIHGNGSHESQWHFIYDYLKKPDIGSVYTFNLDGFYTSQDCKGIDDYSKEVVAPFINKVCEESGVKKVILLGYSMGGLVGADYLVNWAKVNGIAVEMFISLTTPWSASPTQSWFASLPLLNRFYGHSKRSKQMLNEGGFLDDLKGKLSLVQDTIIHNLYSTVDNGLPDTFGKLELESATNKEFHDEGHFTVLKSKAVWEHIANLLSSLAK